MHVVYERAESWRLFVLRLARVNWSRTVVFPLAAVAWVVLAAGGQASASASASAGQGLFSWPRSVPRPPPWRAVGAPWT